VEGAEIGTSITLLKTPAQIGRNRSGGALQIERSRFVLWNYIAERVRDKVRLRIRNGIPQKTNRVNDFHNPQPKDPYPSLNM